MSELQIDNEIKELQDKIQNAKNIKENLEKVFSYTFSTNTAYLMNMGVTQIFSNFGNFSDWVKTKHEQHWKNICSSECEVTIRVKEKQSINQTNSSENKK